MYSVTFSNDGKKLKKNSTLVQFKQFLIFIFTNTSCNSSITAPKTHTTITVLLIIYTLICYSKYLSIYI